MNNLIINGIDHSKFDLEWAKRGGVVYHYCDFCRYICDGDNYNEIRAGQDGECLIGVEKTVGLLSILTTEKVENSPYYLRMATPAECAEAGVEYIEPPVDKVQTAKAFTTLDRIIHNLIVRMQCATIDKRNSNIYAGFTWIENHLDELGLYPSEKETDAEKFWAEQSISPAEPPKDE